MLWVLGLANMQLRAILAAKSLESEAEEIMQCGYVEKKDEALLQ